MQCQTVITIKPNCLKRAETIVVLIVINGVLSHARAYPVTVSYRRFT